MDEQNLQLDEQAVTACEEENPKNGLNFSKSKIFTIPNLLSVIRIALVPFIVWLYCVKKEFGATAIIVLISGVTDVIDGVIARKFHMTSDLGKILDPIADKLTQATVMICLLTTFPNFLIPLIALIVKEIVAAVTGLIRIKRTSKVHSADWHGKVTTVLLYATMVLHVFWYDINLALSNVLIIACTGMIVLSGIIYAITNISIALFGGKKQEEK